MTNGEKYKTAQMRLAAFTAFCNGKSCIECELLGGLRSGGVGKCAFDWLEREYKPAVNACPICGNIHPDIIIEGEAYYVSCRTCHMRGPEMEFKEKAIEHWNKLRRDK